MTALNELTSLHDEIASLRAQLAAALAPGPSKIKLSKSTSHWSDHIAAARAVAIAEHGPRAWMAPGVMPWSRLSASAARWKSPRGVVVKWTRDMRLPAERYWASGTYPAVDAVADCTPPRIDRAGSCAAVMAGELSVRHHWRAYRKAMTKRVALGYVAEAHIRTVRAAIHDLRSARHALAS